MGLIAAAGSAAAAPTGPDGGPSSPPAQVLGFGDDALEPPDPPGVRTLAGSLSYERSKGRGLYDVVVVGVSTPTVRSEATAANSAVTINRADAHWDYATQGAYRLSYRAFVPLQFAGNPCDLWALTDASSAAVRNATGDLTPRPWHVGVLVVHALPEATGCGPGVGSLGGITQYVTGQWADADIAQSVAHEAGHNFNLGHANSLTCSRSPYFSDNPSVHLPAWPCGVYEYGDLSSIMGAGISGGGSWPSTRRLPFTQLQHLGLIDASALVVLGAGAGQVQLNPIDTSATGPRGLRLQVPGTSAVSGNVPALQSVTLEYRTSTNLVTRPGVFLTADAGSGTYAQSWAYVGASYFDQDFGLKANTRIKLADGRRIVVGDVGATATVTVTAAGTPIPPTEPRILDATGGLGTAVLTFRAPEDDGGAPVTAYHVTADAGQTWRSCALPNPGAQYCTVSGLPAGVTSQVSLRAVTSAGAGRGSSLRDVYVDAGPPSAPTGLRAAAGDRSAVITFSAPASDGGQLLGIGGVSPTDDDHKIAPARELLRLLLPRPRCITYCIKNLRACIYFFYKLCAF